MLETLEGLHAHGPYAPLIGRIVLGRSVAEGEIDRLPQPDTFRDAYFLSKHGHWSPRDLDEADALLVALVRKFLKANIK